MTIGWLDLSAGASGDMLLGALVDAGVPLEVLADRRRRAPGRADPAGDRADDPARARRHPGARARARSPSQHRTWPDVRALLAEAALAPAVRDGALAVFERLAVAEGRVHRISPEEVHFHEVGALDALADVVGVVAGFEHLGLDRLTASPVALGSGSARGAHGVVPIPGPAVLELLAGIPVVAGAVPAEMCTPTGAALVAHRVDEWTTLPPMRVERVGTGAGGRDPGELPNVVRLVLGDRRTTAPPGARWSWRPTSTTSTRGCGRACSTRCSPPGASDAWLTPILMKKGRPAHTLSVLCRPEVVADVQAAVFAATSTIGLRVVPVGKVAIERARRRSRCSAAASA